VDFNLAEFDEALDEAAQAVFVEIDGGGMGHWSRLYVGWALRRLGRARAPCAAYAMPTRSGGVGKIAKAILPTLQAN